MVVEKGYKETEIGVFPKDWDLITVDKIFTFYSTSNYSKAQMTLAGEVGCIHYGLIHAIPNSTYDVQDGIKYFISQEQAKYEIIKNGDIVMVDASEDMEGVNKSVELFGIENGKYIAGLHTFLLRDTNSILANNFRGAILNSRIIKNQLHRLAVGMKVFGVSKPQLKTVLIPVPPLPEQTAIATALSDMDALIAQTEKLIEKKKAIMHGVMQELLRPKVGWNKNKISEVYKIFKGRGLSKGKLHESGENSCILYGELFTTYKEEINEIFGRTSFNEGVISVKDDILFPGSTTTTGADLAKASTLSQSGVQLGGDIIILRKSLTELDSLFVTYFLNCFRKNQIAQLTKGITIHHLYGKDLLDIEIEFPEYMEQIKISNTLRTFVNELNTLENKLQKLTNQKQGMMQTLLTGKIRLV